MRVCNFWKLFFYFCFLTNFVSSSFFLYIFSFSLFTIVDFLWCFLFLSSNKSYHVWCGCFSYLMLLINFTFLDLFFLLHHTIPWFFAWFIIDFYYLWYHSLPLILYMVLALVFGYSILSFLLLVDFLLNLYLLVIVLLILILLYLCSYVWSFLLAVCSDSGFLLFNSLFHLKEGLLIPLLEMVDPCRR